MSDTRIHPTNAFGLGDEASRDHKANAQRRHEQRESAMEAQRARREGRAVTVPRETSPLRSSGQPGDTGEQDLATQAPSGIDG